MIFVLDDDLGLSKNLNPCIFVPAANSRNTFNTTISNWNWTEMQHNINFYLILHSGCFSELCYKNYYRYQQVKNLKIKGSIVISILIVDEAIVPIFFCLITKTSLRDKVSSKCITVRPRDTWPQAARSLDNARFWIGSIKIWVEQIYSNHSIIRPGRLST